MSLEVFSILGLGEANLVLQVLQVLQVLLM